MRSIFLLAFCFVFLTGCLGEKKGSDNSARAAVKGLVVLQEYAGNLYASAKSQVEATFGSLEGGSIVQRKHAVLGDLRTAGSADEDITKCKVIPNAAYRAITPTSLGEIIFELRDSSENISASYAMSESPAHLYSRTLNTEIIAGVHSVFSKGSAKSFPFRAPISMPEVIKNATANSIPFIEANPQLVTISKAGTLTLEWEKPTTSMEYNDMYVNVFGNDELLLCGVVEEKLPQSGGRIRWELPAGYLPQLHVVATSKLFLFREHYIPLQDKQGNRFDVVGDRVLGNFATVAD
jgi:hypothetical protein